MPMDEFKAYQVKRTVNQANLPDEQGHMLSDSAKQLHQMTKPTKSNKQSPLHHLIKQSLSSSEINHPNKSIHIDNNTH